MCGRDSLMQDSNREFLVSSANEHFARMHRAWEADNGGRGRGLNLNVGVARSARRQIASMTDLRMAEFETENGAQIVWLQVAVP